MSEPELYAKLRKVKLRKVKYIDLGSGRIARKDIEAADLILAVDKTADDKGPAILYGRDMLDFIISSDMASEALVMSISMDPQTLELEAAIDLVTAIKGSCDYKGSKEE